MGWAKRANKPSRRTIFVGGLALTTVPMFPYEPLARPVTMQTEDGWKLRGLVLWLGTRIGVWTGLHRGLVLALPIDVGPWHLLRATGELTIIGLAIWLLVT